MSEESGFGMAPIKKEGWPIHPDEVNPEMSDEAYIRQFEGYVEACRSAGISEDTIRSYRRHAVRNNLVNE